jgi:uncharacterized protein GlcG (DUF336 family)
MKRIAILAMLAVLVGSPILGDTPPAKPAGLPPPPADEMPLAVAIEWAQTAIAACKEQGFNVTAAYMNREYGLKLVMRADGANAITTDFARRKAYTVIKTGMSSGDYAASIGFTPDKKLSPPEPGQPFAAPPGNPDTNLIVLAGGQPVKVAGKITGAVAVSGAFGPGVDDACVEAGLARIADKLK